MFDCSHYDNVQRGYGRKKKNKYRPPYFLSGPLAPVPGGLGAMGYPYQSYLKKIFSLTLISHRTNHKKFTYRNPYAKRTCFSFHSSNPNIIEIKAPQLVIPPNQERFARLTFHPASPGNSECLLYIHNDDADRNEECIRFDLSYMKDATNPYDKFAGLYGAKTYWGYDGADTGEDPFEARMWDTRNEPVQRQQQAKPGLWDGGAGWDDGPGYREQWDDIGIGRSDRGRDDFRPSHNSSYDGPPRSSNQGSGRDFERDSHDRSGNDERSFFDEGRRRSQNFGGGSGADEFFGSGQKDQFGLDSESSFFKEGADRARVSSPGRATSGGFGGDRVSSGASNFLEQGRDKVILSHTPV
jgi:hypothetical protein